MKLTHSEDKTSSYEADSLSATKEIPPFLMNLISHYRNHSCPPLLHIPIHMNPLRTLFFQMVFCLSDFPGNKLFVILIFVVHVACLVILSSLIW
jgi:hypothetical protein